MLSSFCLVSLAISELININKVNYAEYTDLCSSNPSGISVHVWLAEKGHVSCSTEHSTIQPPSGVSVHARSARIGHVHFIAKHTTLQTYQVFVFTPDLLEQVTFIVVQGIVLFKPMRYFCSRPIGYNLSRTLYYRAWHFSNRSGIWLAIAGHVHYSTEYYTV